MKWLEAGSRQDRQPFHLDGFNITQVQGVCVETFRTCFPSVFKSWLLGCTHRGLTKNHPGISFSYFLNSEVISKHKYKCWSP